MADEVVMTPVEAAEPPKVNPLAKPGATATVARPGLKLPPKPGLATGLKLPPKPGATVSALKTGLKLPPKPGLASGLKLPAKPGATVSALKTGLKLPPKPGLSSGLKLPPRPGATVAAKPLIRKPGATVAAAPLPKPVVPKPVASIDAQGVVKLPTVSATAISRDSAAETPVEMPKPLESLKSVTQKLKGLTQRIPQDALLHKTGIIAGAAVTEALKEAAKHKTARISLSEAMGAAPVKEEPAPMKTIRIKRPVNLPGTSAAPAATAPAATPSPAPAPTPTPTSNSNSSPTPTPTSNSNASPTPTPTPTSNSNSSPSPSPAPATSITQRKTLKIARPGTAVRPTGKFALRKPGAPTTVAKKPAAPAAATSDAKTAAPAAEGEVADIPDLPATPAAPVPQPVVEAKTGFGTTLAVVVQLAASIAIGALAWFLYQNTQTSYF